MNVSAKAVAYPVIFALIAGSVVGCGRKVPSTSDIKTSISQNVSGYSIKDGDCETFSDKSQEGAGRASCRGTLTLNEDLYASVSKSDVQALLVSAGIPQEGSEFFIGRHVRDVFVPSSNKGAEIPFNSDCTYLGNVDGWSISCGTNFSRLPGQPLGSMGANSVLKGSPQYESYIKEVMADYQQLDAAYQSVKTGIEQFFAVGRTVSATNPYNNGAIARTRITSPLAWSGPRGFMGYQSEFAFETKYVDLRDNPGSTFCGYAKGEPGDDLRIAGNIRRAPHTNTSDLNAVSFIATLYMMNRSSLFKNNFQSCGNSLNWNGTTWKGSWGTLELKSS